MVNILSTATTGASTRSSMGHKLGPHATALNVAHPTCILNIAKHNYDSLKYTEVMKKL